MEGDEFMDGHALKMATAALAAIGRMLINRIEAGRLLRKIERQMPKWSPASSLKRRAAMWERA
jgi:hypothetical protein